MVSLVRVSFRFPFPSLFFSSSLSFPSCLSPLLSHFLFPFSLPHAANGPQIQLGYLGERCYNCWYLSPRNMSDTMPSHSSRASSSGYIFLPRTERRFGDRAFSVAAPRVRVESATDRTETHAVVDNNIQASPKDILIQLGIHFPLTMECAVGLGSALQMLLLLLLMATWFYCQTKKSAVLSVLDMLFKVYRSLKSSAIVRSAV